jgi:hypothetical protein
MSMQHGARTLAAPTPGSQLINRLFCLFEDQFYSVNSRVTPPSPNTQNIDLTQNVKYMICNYTVQCCGAGAGAARSRNIWPELEPYTEVSAPAPGSGSRSNYSNVFNHNSY